MSNNNLKPSSIQFGSIEKKNMKSNFTFIDVVKSGYWEIDIESFIINGVKTDYCDRLRRISGRCGAAIDSGTSLYGMPTFILEDLENLLNIKQSCSNFKYLPNIEIMVKARKSYFDNDNYDYVNLTLKPEDYVINGHEIKNSIESNFNLNECTGAFMPLDVPIPRGPLFVLGEHFMRKFYTVFDRDQNVVGLSYANQDTINDNTSFLNIETPYNKNPLNDNENLYNHFLSDINNLNNNNSLINKI